MVCYEHDNVAQSFMKCKELFDLLRVEYLF
jgi:hypothetical protein